MDQIEPTWAEIELPILRAIVLAENNGDDVNSAAKAAGAELTNDEYLRTIVRLHEADYIDAAILRGGGKIANARIRSAKERALRAVGLWPHGDVSAQLLESLDQLIEHETNAERKSRLQKLRDTVMASGREVIVEVGAEFAKRMAGLQ